MLQMMPTGASLGAPSGAHGCPAGCLEQYPPMPLRVPLRVPQAMPRGARSMGTACPAGRPARCPGAGGRWSRGWGKSHPWAKSGKRTETAPKRRRGGSRPDRASYPNQKSRRSASAPPAAPPAFSGGPRSPGAGGAPSPQLYFTRSPDSRFRFAAADTHRERTRAAGRGRAPRAPRAPWPRMTPPDPRSPPWCFTIFDYTIVRSHYR